MSDLWDNAMSAARPLVIVLAVGVFGFMVTVSTLAVSDLATQTDADKNVEALRQAYAKKLGELGQCNIERGEGQKAIADIVSGSLMTKADFIKLFERQNVGLTLDETTLKPVEKKAK